MPLATAVAADTTTGRIEMAVGVAMPSTMSPKSTLVSPMVLRMAQLSS
jgi:hypothetical protein